MAYRARSPRWAAPILGVLMIAAVTSLTSATASATSIHANASGSGTISGTITITGAPSGFDPPFVGVGACAAPTTTTCPSPEYALAQGGPATWTYSISLVAGSWDLQGFYELQGFGGAFLGTPMTSPITVTAGQTETGVNLTIPYAKPGSATGTVTFTGTSPTPIQSTAALLCPKADPYAGGTVPLECVTASVGSNGQFLAADLPPGKWLAYPGEVTKYGLAIGTKATPFAIAPGGRTTVDLTSPQIRPADGIVTGAIKTAGGPAHADRYLSILACPSTTFSPTCTGLEQFYASDSYNLTLPAGQWSLAVTYDRSPYVDEEIGPVLHVTVAPGATVTHALKITVLPEGTVSGTIAIDGIPNGTSVDTYSVLACPAMYPWDGVSPDDPACASEVSGDAQGGSGVLIATNTKESHQRARDVPDDVFSLSLPQGSWILYPSYTTDYGSTVSSVGTPVTVAASPTTQALIMTYTSPTEGNVVGTATLLDAPRTLGALGVEACLTEPSTGSQSLCGVFTGQIGPDGAYQLILPAGTWWIAEVYEYGSGGSQGGPEIYGLSGPAQQVTVTAGATTDQDVSATYGPPPG